MTSRSAVLDESPVLLGADHPRLLHLPEGAVSSAGAEAVELCQLAGLELDPAQAFALSTVLSERRDGSHAAFEAAVIEPRQNGKGAITEGRELTGLFLLRERVIVHTSHWFPTTKAAFERLLSLIQNTPDLDRKVAKVMQSNEVYIRLLPKFGGCEIRFVARTKSSGRGLTGDLVVLDEALELQPESVAALVPTLSARPNPQLLYTSTAPLKHSRVLHALRKRALIGKSPRLAYLEWSVDADALSDDEAERDAQRRDRRLWAQANPALGRRISEAFIEAELETFSARVADWETERLGVPQHPAGGAGVIELRAWLALADAQSSPARVAAFTLDVGPRGAWATFGVGGVRADGVPHVEVADRKQGTAWVVARAVELQARHGAPLMVLPKHPTAGLLDDLRAAKVELVEVAGGDWERACAAFDAAVRDRHLRHIGEADPWHEVVHDALLGAEVVESDGGLWRWSHGSSACDITPLVALTLAHHGATALAPTKKAPNLW